MIIDGAGIIRGNQSDGSLDVNIQDQTTPPVASLFYESLTNFTISTDTTASTLDTLQYTFEATAGHGISLGEEIILLDVVGDWSFIAEVTNVATNTITVDRPIDHVFPSATSLGRRINSNMNVDGSGTERIFTLRAGATPLDIQELVISISDDAQMDYSTFGGIVDGIGRGIVFRIVDGYQKTIYNFKTNGDFEKFGGVNSYHDKTTGSGGEYSITSKFDFKELLGVVFRLSGTGALQIVVQDDLQSLISITTTGLGQETVGEV